MEGFLHSGVVPRARLDALVSGRSGPFGSAAASAAVRASAIAAGPQAPFGAGCCAAAAGLASFAHTNLALAALRWRRRRTRWLVRRAASTELILGPALAHELESAVARAEKVLGRKPAVLFTEPKEGPGPITGFMPSKGGDAGTLPTGIPPVPLRTMEPDSYDIIVEANALEAGFGNHRQAWQRHFYPYGGHSESLAMGLIINLASVAKVLRPGGTFLCRTIAESEEDPLPFGFLRLRHLDWDVDFVAPAAAGSPEAVVRCTLRPGAAASLAAHTARVLAEEVGMEESRRRYAEVLRPLLRGARRRDFPLTVLDVGGGDGSLAAWFYDPDIAAEDGPARVTLMEENTELAGRAAARLPVAPADGSPSAAIVAHGVGPWPFRAGEFDAVVLAFILHHVQPGSCDEVLREAHRVARDRVIVLEDQPPAAESEPARSLAWQITKDHFRPFGQDPAEYISNIRTDAEWQKLFAGCGFQVVGAEPFPGTLRHPVPHIAYHLSPIR